MAVAIATAAESPIQVPAPAPVPAPVSGKALGKCKRRSARSGIRAKSQKWDQGEEEARWQISWGYGGRSGACSTAILPYSFFFICDFTPNVYCIRAVKRISALASQGARVLNWYLVLNGRRVRHIHAYIFSGQRGINEVVRVLCMIPHSDFVSSKISATSQCPLPRLIIFRKQVRQP